MSLHVYICLYIHTSLGETRIEFIRLKDFIIIDFGFCEGNLMK